MNQNTHQIKTPLSAACDLAAEAIVSKDPTLKDHLRHQANQSLRLAWLQLDLARIITLATISTFILSNTALAGGMGGYTNDLTWVLHILKHLISQIIP